MQSSKKLKSQKRSSSSKSNNSYSKAKKRMLAEVSPVSPPAEIIAQIQSITEEEGLGKEKVVDLLNSFFEHRKINPEESPIVAILRSGYQIPIEPEKELLDDLTNAIIGESIVAFGGSGKRRWSGMWKEIITEVEHVRDTVHDMTARSLFGYLLFESVSDKYQELMHEAFPNLRGDPENVAKLLDDTKSGMVLLLGKDTGQSLRLLNRVKRVLESQGLSCILIRDIPENPTQGLISKVLLYAMLARYVIIENTYPSGHLYELPFVRNAESVIAIIQQEGRGASRMPDDMIPKHPLINRFWYQTDMLEDTVKNAMNWAEGRVQENIEINRSAWTEQ